MRFRPESGCEWGSEWIVKEIIAEALKPISIDHIFEESTRECYPESVSVGWLELDTVTVLKEMDPVSWDVAKGDWISSEESEGLITSFDHGENYYYTQDIERFLDESEALDNSEVCA